MTNRKLPLSRLAVVTDEISDNFAEAITMAAAKGIRSVEIRGVYGHRVPDVSSEHLDLIRQSIESHQMNVLGISPGIGKDVIPVNLDTMVKRSIECALTLGASSLTFFSFAGSAAHEKEVATATDALSSVAEKCRTNGLVPCLEPAGTDCIAGTTEVLFTMAANSGMKVIWDPANTVAAGDEATPELTASHIASVERVHVKGHDPLKGPIFLDEGIIDWYNHIESLENAGYRGYYTIEPHQWQNRFEAFRRYVDYLGDF